VNIKETLENTVNFFEEHNIENARLDAEILLADLLNMERIDLYLNFDLPLKGEELEEYRKRIIKRARREPVAYITGYKEFMSLNFNVNKSVLIPRPETELLVEEILSYCKENDIVSPNIVDVGVGSGAIAVSIAYYMERAKVLGIDISESVLKIASLNIKKYNLDKRVKVIKGDLISPLIKMGKNNVDIIVSNPPYISKEEMKTLPEEVLKEPGLALYGGSDGLDIYKRLIKQVEGFLSRGLLALEIGNRQANSVKGFFSRGFWNKIEIKQDYSGNDRLIMALREPGTKLRPVVE
jgi:release factor glutamine methyltransferase